MGGLDSDSAGHFGAKTVAAAGGRLGRDSRVGVRGGDVAAGVGEDLGAARR